MIYSSLLLWYYFSQQDLVSTSKDETVLQGSALSIVLTAANVRRQLATLVDQQPPADVNGAKSKRSRKKKAKSDRKKTRSEASPGRTGRPKEGTTDEAPSRVIVHCAVRVKEGGYLFTVGKAVIRVKHCECRSLPM